MKYFKFMLILLFIVAIVQSARASWTEATPVTNDGTGFCEFAICGHSPDHFGGDVSNCYYQTYANEYGYPWSCGNCSAFAYSAYARDTQWKKRWDWSGGTTPSNEACLKVDAQMTWKIDGDCGNFNPFTNAMSKTYTHSNLVINTAPDNNGDYTGDGEWSGQKREGSTWSGGLKLDWKDGVPGGEVGLTWSSGPGDSWISGELTKSYQYRQNVKNHVGGVSYDYIWTEICLLSEAQAEADTNAYHAVAYTRCKITMFKLNQPA